MLLLLLVVVVVVLLMLEALTEGGEGESPPFSRLLGSSGKELERVSDPKLMSC